MGAIALQLSLTDPKTLADYPVAYVRIAPPSLPDEFVASVFCKQAAADAAADPVSTLAPFTLTQAERQQLRDAMLATLYGFAKARGAFKSAVDV